MPEIEGGKRSSSKWWRPVVLLATLLLGVVLGLVIALPFRWHGAETNPAAAVGPALPFVLKDWEYPDAKSNTKAEGGSSEVKRFGVTTSVAFAPSLYTYSSPDALEKVWGHYAKLSGNSTQDILKITEEFKPGASSAGGTAAAIGSAGGGSTAMSAVLYNTGDIRRQSVHSFTIVVQQPGYTVSVFVTRGKDEDQTYIDLVVEKKPLPSSP